MKQKAVLISIFLTVIVFAVMAGTVVTGERVSITSELLSQSGTGNEGFIQSTPVLKNIEADTTPKETPGITTSASLTKPAHRPTQVMRPTPNIWKNQSPQRFFLLLGGNPIIDYGLNAIVLPSATPTPNHYRPTPFAKFGNQGTSG